MREDHLALARGLKSLTEAHRTSRYLHSYSGQDRLLDLTDVDGGRFWSLLDDAEALGIVLLDDERRGAEIPHYRTAELLIDVIVRADGAAEVRPTLRDDTASATTRRLPVLFLGTSGHGLVVRELRDPSTDSETGDLRLIRLGRPTPEQLRMMVLGGERLTIAPGDLALFATRGRTGAPEHRAGGVQRRVVQGGGGITPRARAERQPPTGTRHVPWLAVPLRGGRSHNRGRFGRLPWC